MSKFEGRIYEDIAIRWFKAKNLTILKHQFAYGIDFLVKNLDNQELWYEVKGKMLLDIYRSSQSFRVTGIKVANVEIDPINFYLLIIYDNFTNMFRIFEIHKDIINDIRKKEKESTHIPLYQIFKRIGINDIIFNINDIDISKRKFLFET